MGNELIARIVGRGKLSSVVELGKIKIGGLGEARTSRANTTYRMPQKHDYFTITGMSRDANGNLIEDTALMKSLIEDYGDLDGRLRNLPIRVMSDIPDEILVSRLCWYGNRSLGATSDGQQVTWFRDPVQPYPELKPPRVEPWRDEMLDLTNHKGEKIFKLHFIFACSIASREARFGGIYKFRSTSMISFRQMLAGLHDIRNLTGGVLIGMPLWMVLRPMQVEVEGKPTTVQVVHLELRGSDIQEIQQLALKNQQLRVGFKQSMDAIQQEYRTVLAEPGAEGPGEAEFIADEFAPEPQGLGHDYWKLASAAWFQVVYSARKLTGSPREAFAVWLKASGFDGPFLANNHDQWTENDYVGVMAAIDAEANSSAITTESKVEPSSEAGETGPGPIPF